jgi:hypothetical protein
MVWSQQVAHWMSQGLELSGNSSQIPPVPMLGMIVEYRRGRAVVGRAANSAATEHANSLW